MSSKQILFIAIATFATITIWVVADIIHTRSQIKTAPVVEKLLEPIQTSFDLEALEK